MSSVAVTREGRIAWLELARPEKRNAVDQGMRAELKAALGELAEDRAVRVVILVGAGKSFCAGVDLKDAKAPDHPLAPGLERLTKDLDDFPKPTIAAIQGNAVGGGCELALACDIRVAGGDARFALPEVKIGSLPGSGGTQRLASSVSASDSALIVLTGAPVDAAEAFRIGLVSRLVDEGQERVAAREIAEQIAANAPLSTLAAKAALRAAREPLGEQGGLAVERLLWAVLFGSEDRKEGRTAFREGRAPRFEGR
ncbi:MAG TPA: enoyl-CoA hydratase/isomerase family protein [Solirubrobacterales bacterium]|nr:enoyl-CoA hydratase/isomerase family protein [Solirubrobacterales bacterium]